MVGSMIHLIMEIDPMDSPLVFYGEDEASIYIPVREWEKLGKPTKVAISIEPVILNDPAPRRAA